MGVWVGRDSREMGKDTADARGQKERGAECKNDSPTVAKDIQMLQGVKLSNLKS